MENVPYLGDPAGVRLMPGAAETLGTLEQAGLDLFIVSNQSGVGRGLITHQQVAAVNKELLRQLGHPPFKEIYNAFGRDSDPNRKPSPLLLHRAARTHCLDLTHSYFVGDRLSDILCGRNAGCRTVLVRTGANTLEWPRASRLADHTAANLTEAGQWIIADAAK